MLETYFGTKIDMNIIINLDIKLSIPLCNCTGKEGFGFCRQIVISFDMVLQQVNNSFHGKKETQNQENRKPNPRKNQVGELVSPAYRNLCVEHLLNQFPYPLNYLASHYQYMQVRV